MGTNNTLQTDAVFFRDPAGATIIPPADGITVQNIGGSLKQVDSQGNVSSLGGSGGTVTADAPLSGNGSSGSHLGLTAAAPGVLGAIAAGAYVNIPALPVTDPWFAETLARIQTYDATLTNVLMADEMGILTNWGGIITTSGTIKSGSASSVDLQTGTTSGGAAILQVPNVTGAAHSAEMIPNVQTNHWAVAMRCTKIAIIATSSSYITLTDNVGATVPILGVLGATSQTTYSVKCGSASAVDTTVAISSAGTYDTLVMLNDGTNFKVDINGAAPGAGASHSNSTLGATFGIPALVALQSAAANSGFRIDKVLVVSTAAA